jgi:DNA-binding transcriptional ArsR family regulator
MQTRRDPFQAIADPTRREIIDLIAYQSLNLNAIAENFAVSRPAISQHIKILTECGLIVIRRQGRERFCEARLSSLHEVADWVEKFRKAWAVQFEALDGLLDEMKAANKQRPPKRPAKRKK